MHVTFLYASTLEACGASVKDCADLGYGKRIATHDFIDPEQETLFVEYYCYKFILVH